HYLLERNYGVLGGSTKRAIGLSAVAPNAASDPFPRDTLADCIDRTRTVAVRNDTRIWHSDAKRILSFLHITRIYAGKGNANPNLTCVGIRVVHLTNYQNISGSTLPFIPRSFHSSESLLILCTFYSVSSHRT